MKFAIIGCGRISPNHMIAAKKNNLNVVALCDLELDNINKALQKANVNFDCPQYTDYKKMLNDTKPELVAIATESGKHAQIALDCINLGINVIIEKPIALSMIDAENIIKAAKEKNVKVSACHQNRFNKSIIKMREALESKRFGKILYGTAHIRWNRGVQYYEQAKWRGTWSQDGGALMNQCIHNIDLLRWMMGGEVIEVYGMTDKLNHDYIEAEDLGLAIVKFKNNSYGIIEGTTNIFPKNLEETLYLFGEKGTVKVGGESVNIIEEWRFADGIDNADDIKKQSAEQPPNVYGFGHVRLYEDVINAIKTNSEPKVNGQAGKDALEIILAIYKSCKEGKPVKLPLQDFSTEEMRGFFDEKQ